MTASLVFLETEVILDFLDLRDYQELQAPLELILLVLWDSVGPLVSRDLQESRVSQDQRVLLVKMMVTFKIATRSF